ncbi:tyrosine-type recombinase/integrase [Vibrio jasicida]|uniref:tyrosine-type recombinase/integrase n=1 Tax=Vibrio jasicida TaxID=766224 RepID=UPI0007AF2C8F|nr:tyrosine-type recombinase/integrase [Vibrio jasicida]
MIQTGDTIMFLLRDRNATYYARYYFSQKLQSIGYPKELRFSLLTKTRSEAIDRGLVVISIIRQSVRHLSHDECVEHALSQLREQITHYRKNHFPKGLPRVTELSVAPLAYVGNAAPQAQARNVNYLSEFIQSKKLENILPRTIQQLESRVTAFLTSSNLTKSQLKARSKDAMAFRDKLLMSGKSEKTVSEYLAAIKQFYGWLSIRGDIDANPIEKVTVKRKKSRVSDERPRWSATELSKLFRHRNFSRLSSDTPDRLYSQKEQEDYWVPLILLYTGARVSEICQLSTSDVMEREGIWSISINEEGKHKRLKSAAATRVVPIHSKLMKLGFLQYVQMRKEQNVNQLFSFTPYGRDKDWSKAFVVRFSKVLDEIGLMRGRRPTLHSLRHTFIDELQQAGIQEHYVADLVGHSKKSITYARYAKQLNLSALHDVVQAVEYRLVEKGVKIVQL